MCSTIIQVAFNILLVVALGLTITALFTPGWAKFHDGKEGVSAERGFFVCKTLDEVITKARIEKCARETWNDLKDWEKGTFACLVLSAVVGAAALVWSMAVCCVLFCCKDCLAHPLPVMTGIACILNMVALVVYTSKSSRDPPEISMTSAGLRASFDSLGYSVWITAVSVAMYFVDTLVGILLLNVSKYLPI